MEEWQKVYNAFFNDLAVDSVLEDKKIYCENCGCGFEEHRYRYAKNKEQTECENCEDCTWFKPMGSTKIEQIIPALKTIKKENK